MDVVEIIMKFPLNKSQSVYFFIKTREVDLLSSLLIYITISVWS